MSKRRLLLLAIAASVAGIAFGCNAIFGVGDYVVVDDASVSETGSSGGGGDGASCDDFDLAKGQCYPCAPSADPQFLNACTGAACVPFDDKARVPRMAADGGLPPVPDLPPADAGPG